MSPTRQWFFAGCLAMTATVATVAQAELPPYLMLSPGSYHAHPVVRDIHNHLHHLPPPAGVGRPVSVARQGYAYGWFGVPARRQPVRHFGYRQKYTQWTCQ